MDQIKHGAEERHAGSTNYHGNQKVLAHRLWLIKGFDHGCGGKQSGGRSGNWYSAVCVFCSNGPSRMLNRSGSWNKPVLTPEAAPRTSTRPWWTEHYCVGCYRQRLTVNIEGKIIWIYNKLDQITLSWWVITPKLRLAESGQFVAGRMVRRVILAFCKVVENGRCQRQAWKITIVKTLEGMRKHSSREPHTKRQ